ncbi:hypothetical protein CLV51_108130 [Chitinophaga niastensis]|uniref:Acetyltransferase (GNAT) family protein n=1 Tax=Chitinophaga niastensis TaxID=536980 RepID=A0A2P8HB46_CHINA|nr:GNAT family N-acetyltransferase [Chitinophaga niastensis]PSL43440.1 hypothetical protein CLV51_108130 [Chitinophaga niastensis]
MSNSNPTILQLAEIDELLALQRSNLVQHIDVFTAASQGFLTFEYSEPVLLRMMQDMPQPISRVDDEMIGYALAITREACQDIELMHPLAELTQTLEINGTKMSALKYYFMGQICVKDGHRGKGVFDMLYEHHRALFSGEYDCLVTEIAAANLRSQAAHDRVGFEVIHVYTDHNDKEWQVVAWDWR